MQFGTFRRRSVLINGLAIFCVSLIAFNRASYRLVHYKMFVKEVDGVSFKADSKFHPMTSLVSNYYN